MKILKNILFVVLFVILTIFTADTLFHYNGIKYCPRCHDGILYNEGYQEKNGIEIYQYKCPKCKGRSNYIQENYKDGVMIYRVPLME